MRVLRLRRDFRKVNAASDIAYTNRKVIVARSYASLFAQTDPDPSARDDVGHGTGTAMAAAGVREYRPAGDDYRSGALAYLGNYKVFGSPGVNDSATENFAILKAIDDAVSDGMDVINLSLGTPFAPRPFDDPEVLALENGRLIRRHCGGRGGQHWSGPQHHLIARYRTLGASRRARRTTTGHFYTYAKVGGGGPYLAVPASETLPSNPITAPLVDVAEAGSHRVSLRGPSGEEPYREHRADPARHLRFLGQADRRAAGRSCSRAALFGTVQSGPDHHGRGERYSAGGDGELLRMVLPSSNWPRSRSRRLWISPNTDLSRWTPIASLPSPRAVPTWTWPSSRTCWQSARTCTPRRKMSIPQGELYSANGYVTNVAGTSFSAPLVSGAAAVLEAARPGFTALQYRSLLINSAASAFSPPGQPQHVQDAGAGLLDLSAAVRSTLAAAPASISFGAGPGDAQLSASLRLSNIGYNADNFLISVLPFANSPAPVPSTTSVQLQSNTYFDVALTFTASGLAAGEYDGFIVIQGTNSGIEARVPYWYAVASSSPAVIVVLSTPDTPPAPGSTVTDAIDFRVTDASGIIVGSVAPTVTVTSGGGSVLSITSEDDSYPGVWSVAIRMGPTSGASNVFQIVAGGISQDVTIIAQ